MRIAVLYRTTDGPWGGGNSFFRSLKKTWREMGIEVRDCLQHDLDGVLINSSYLGAVGRKRNLTPEMAKRAVETGYLNPFMPLLGFSRWQRKGRPPPFVHRLDGVFRLYGREANDPDDIAQVGINRYMDWTIYQSEYCRDSFSAEGLDVSNSSVIWNGVDTDVFYPARETNDLKPFKLVSVAWSPNTRKGAPYALRASLIPGVEMTFIGQWPNELDPGNVRLIPPCSHEELALRLRQHHAFLHMAQNDPCSNAILEGMASGLPVIYHPSGGSPEIVNSCGVPGEPNFELAVRQVRDRYYGLRSITMAHIPEFSIKRAARQYLKVFEDIQGLYRINYSGRPVVKY